MAKQIKIEDPIVEPTIDKTEETKRNPVQLDKKKHTEAVDFVLRSYKDSLEYQRPFFQKFLAFYRMYRSMREETKQNYAGRAKLYVPYAFATVETVLPRLIGAKPKLEAIPREVSDIDNAKNNTNTFNYEWDLMKMKEILKLWVKQTLIYGTGVIKLYWCYKDNDEYLIDQPKAELIDLFDFFIDPQATTVKDARYIIQRAERNLASLKENSNYIVPKTLTTSVEKDEYKLQRDAIFGLVKPEDKGKVQLLEYWGKYDLGKGEEECILTVANQSLLRAEPNPYLHKEKPFVSMVDTQVPFQFWGIGEIEPIESLQYELNDVRNQRMDNVTLILNRMWKVKKDGGVDEEDLISQAGGVVHVDDMGALEAIATPDVTSSSYNEETLIKTDIQLTSGVNDLISGTGQGKGPGQAGANTSTATGIMLLQEAGNARFKYKLDNIEDSLVNFGEQLLALNQQFIDKSMQIRILGKDGEVWEDVKPEDIKGKYDISVEAGSTQPMNKSVRRAEARELLTTMIPLQKMGIDLKPIIKNLINTYETINSDELFQTQPVVTPGETINGGINANTGAPTAPGMEIPQSFDRPASIAAGANNG